MNWDQVAGNWKQFQGEMKTKWGKLTDNDFTVIAGKRDILAGKLQEVYGYNKERAAEELNSFIDGLRAADEPSDKIAH